jgi:hypothetical protein
MKQILLLLLVVITGCTTYNDPFSTPFPKAHEHCLAEITSNLKQYQLENQAELIAFKKELSSCWIEIPRKPGQIESWTLPELLACIQTRANAVLPPTAPIKILAIIPNHLVQEKTFVEREETNELIALESHLPVDDVLYLYKDICGMQIEYAPRSRTIIFYPTR